MGSLLSFLFLAATLLAALAIGACDDSPTRPTPISPPTPTATATRLALAGPDSVAPGGTAQFNVIAQMSDGSTQEVTNQASWRAGNPGILTVSATGLVTGQQPGETWLSASFGGRSATRSEMLVLPAGTYRVMGVVRDTGIPISGAQVTVTAGAAFGLSAAANPSYRLYGVSGPTELRATKDGYVEQKIRVDVAFHQTVDFDLTLSRPRVEVAGTYTLDVSASADCSDRLPEEARKRTYTAVLAQTGPGIQATLSGATFRSGGSRVLNSFSGTVEQDRTVTFRMSEAGFSYYYYYYYTPDVVEELNPNTYLSIGGVVQATATGATIVGTLNGAFTIVDARLRTVATCRSPRHQFVLSAVRLT